MDVKSDTQQQPTPVAAPQTLLHPSTADPTGSEPPRKRQRTAELETTERAGEGSGCAGSADIRADAGTEADMARNSLPAAQMGADALVRDGTYYMDGADCVIRVEHTLFKVHRFLLARDSSAFQHMFSMPAGQSGDVPTEGFTDERPIELWGESVEHFRALLSILYALPPELQAYNSVKADLDQLLTIVQMTNKYHFSSIESWAVDALYNVTSGIYGAPLHDLSTCTSALITRVLEVALLCGHTRLCDFVVDKWTHRILSRDLQPAPALEIADRHELRALQGIAYYVQLMEVGPGFDAGAVEEEDKDGKGQAKVVLSREQRQRLLSGHWSLVRLWDSLRTSPPKFQRTDGCTYHQHGCLTTWGTVWTEVGKSETTLKYGSADVVGRLRSMEEQLFMNADLSCSLTPQCKRRALTALKATIKEVQDGLADHFVDLTVDLG